MSDDIRRQVREAAKLGRPWTLAQVREALADTADRELADQYEREDHQ